MKDSINRKHNKRWKQATTEMALWLTSPVGDHRHEEGTCDKLNKRHSELPGRGEVQISSSEISAKNEHCSGSITICTVR